MLNNEKIILMTKLALYEQGEGKDKIPVGKYFKSDYIGMRLLSSFVYINIAYFICVILWFMSNGEAIMKKFTSGKMVSTVVLFAAVYLAVVLLYMLVSYVYYTYKFKSIRRSLKEYNARLKELHKIQEKEMETLMNESEIEMEMGGKE